MPTVSLPKLRLLGERETIAPCTTWYHHGEVLGAKFASPVNRRTMLSVPNASVEVVKVATPLVVEGRITKICLSIEETHGSRRRTLAKLLGYRRCECHGLSNGGGIRRGTSGGCGR